MKKLSIGVFIVAVLVAYLFYAIHKVGIWGGLLFVFVSFAALLYHLCFGRRAK